MRDEPDADDTSANASQGGDADGTTPAAAPVAEPPVPEAPVAEAPVAEAPESVAPRRHTRRWFLAGAGALVLGAGGGVLAGAVRHRARPVPHRPPAELLAARAAEVHLVASVAAVAAAEPSRRAQLEQLRRDHEAHLRVVDAALGHYDPATRAARHRATAAAGSPAHTLSGLQRAETSAAGAAAARAQRLAATSQHAALATVFASIAASESTHARLLT